MRNHFEVLSGVLPGTRFEAKGPLTISKRRIGTSHAIIAVDIVQALDMAEVISEQQKALNQALHQQNDQFGNRDDAAGLAKRLGVAIQRMHEMGKCNSVLDYGTGKGKLVSRLKKELPNTITVTGYDPAVEEYSVKPTKAVDILTCLDVLEHIEMSSIDAVLADIKQLTNKFCYLVIDLQPAVKKLADGRNAHILLAPQDWWVMKLSQLFSCTCAFPIYHQAGLPQKVVIACTNNNTSLLDMYLFLIKLRVFETDLAGGVLQGLVKKK